MSIETIIFKIATLSISLLSFFMIVISLNTTEINYASENNVIDISIKLIMKLKSLSNFFLMIVCLLSRTRFDIIEIQPVFERFIVIHFLVTLCIILVKSFLTEELTPQYINVINLELYYSIIVTFVSIIAFLSYTKYKAVHFKYEINSHYRHN